MSTLDMKSPDLKVWKRRSHRMIFTTEKQTKATKRDQTASAVAGWSVVINKGVWQSYVKKALSIRINRNPPRWIINFHIVERFAFRRTAIEITSGAIMTHTQPRFGPLSRFREWKAVMKNQPNFKNERFQMTFWATTKCISSTKW